MGRTHMAFGFLAGLLFYSILGQQWWVFIPIATIASLLPDIDHENSKINRMIPITRWLPKLFKHRGFFHSIFPPLLLFIIFHQANLDIIGIPLTIGYLSHLFSDCLTLMGLNLLHPISTLRIQGFIRTDGIMEYITMGIVSCLSVLVILKQFF